MIAFLIGGSPCTHWSIAQSKNRETTAEGIGWELFENYLIAKEKFKPDFFLYENNKSAAQAIKDQIAEELGAPLQYINSALVSAQNRQRFYVHNFGEVPLPEDRGILLQDVLESGTSWLEKSYAYTTRCTGAIIYDTLKRRRHTMVAERVNGISEKSFEVKNGILDYKGDFYEINLPNGFWSFRKLTVTEAARLQTLPDDYCRAVSDAQAYKGIGNGWTAEVIIHLLSHALKGVPKDEEIVVLSMYDGIGTGRYCFDKLGYHNITYFAYEIDKYAMQIANSNYADIIQCGDAFQVREPSWRLKDGNTIYDFNARDRYKKAVGI